MKDGTGGLQCNRAKQRFLIIFDHYRTLHLSHDIVRSL